MSDDKQSSENKAHDDAVATPDAGAEAEPATTPDALTNRTDESADSAAKPGKSKRKLWLALVGLIIVAAIALYFGRGWLTGAEQQAPVSETRQTLDEPPVAEGNIIPAASVADIDDLRNQLDALNGRLDQITSELRNTGESLATQARETDALERSIESRVDLLDSLPGRVQNNEDALVTLQGISAGSRNAWLLAETEYYMQIANAQMQLANNPQLAAAALTLADQRLRELGDPAYTAIRRQLAEDIATLRGIDKADIEGVTLTLGSLATMVPGLPLKRETVRRTDGSQNIDDSLSGWARVKQSTANFFGSMVRIRESDEIVEPMLPPDAAYFLRLNLQLQLQAARLSLLLGETASYQQALEDAGDWLQRYFDADDKAVQAASEMLAGVKDTTLVSERPDISSALTMLRQQRQIEAIGE